ncbi:hypothetical protein [Streptomyces sp. NPDC054804]
MPPTIRKLTGRIGALVDGVDLAAPADPATVTALRHALDEHKAIVFADVNLDNASVDGRRSEQLVGDASHYSKVLEVAA